MITMSKGKSWAVTMGLLGFLPACLGGEPTSSSGSTPTETTPAEATPTETSPAATAPVGTSPLPEPVAQIKQTNGNTISFYDVDGYSLITGEGSANNPPVFTQDPGKMRPLDAWNKLSGGQVVPQRLLDFQKRLDATPPAPANLKVIKPTATNSTEAGMSIEDLPLNNPDGTLATPVGCNNGCCDQPWLLTFLECGNYGYDFHWFQPNFLWSHATASDIYDVVAMVCGATGTSSWTFTINGKGWTVPVPEAHFLETSWQMGNPWPFYSSGSMNSTINSSTNQHLHAACGNILYW